MTIVPQTFAPTTGSSSTATGNKPAGTVEGDALVAHLAMDNVSVATPPSGWTRIANAGAVEFVDAYVHIVGASDPASYSWALTGFGSWGVIIERYAGVDPVTPMDVAGSAARVFGFTHTVPGITTVTNGAMLVGGSVLNSSTGTWTPPSGWTEVAENGVRVNTYARMLQATAGATGTVTFTSTAEAYASSWIGALRPAAGGGGGGSVPSETINLNGGMQDLTGGING